MRLEENFEDSKYEYNTLSFGLWRGQKWEHETYEEYKEKIDPALKIFDRFNSEEEKKEVINILKKSIENGKDFYANASPRIQKIMKGYNDLLQDGLML